MNPSLNQWSKGKHQWFLAMRWRRDVEKALRPIGLTFTRWLVLEATCDLITESGNAASQREVAARCELGTMVVSKVMRGLQDEGLVDQGPAYASSAYRIWVTEKGVSVAERGRARIAGVCAPWG